MDEAENTNKVIERVVKRLELARLDEGVYAKQYVEDVQSLFDLLVAEEETEEGTPMWGKKEVDTELADLQSDINDTRATVYIVAIDGADKLHATTNLSASWVERLKEMGAVKVFAINVPLPGLVHVDHVFHVRPQEVQVLPIVESPEITQPAQDVPAFLTALSTPPNPGTSRLDQEEARIMEEALREGPNG